MCYKVKKYQYMLGQWLENKCFRGGVGLKVALALLHCLRGDIQAANLHAGLLP
jgi:hypothetical protein